MRKTIAFLKDRSGATAIEYGLIAAAMAVVLVGGMQLIGPGIKNAFTDIKGSLETPSVAAPAEG